jgi:pimeloyl-ACP methyl ester carboxylesterase
MSQQVLSRNNVRVFGTGAQPMLFAHGFGCDQNMWRFVAPAFADDYKIVLFDYVGSGKSDLAAYDPERYGSLDGYAQDVLDICHTLDLEDVIFVGHSVSAMVGVLAANREPERFARLVLVSCEAFENCPPGLPGKNMQLMGRPPGGVNAMLQPLRLRALRRLPVAYGWMAKRLPHELSDEWLRPALSQRAIRRDIAKFIRSAETERVAADTERLRSFDRPALVVWAEEDRVMRRDHGRRLAELLPQGRLVEVPDSYTLIPVDQPAVLAREIRAFVRETAAATAAGTARAR